MEIRQLSAGDSEKYRTLRLEALQSCPTAFAVSYEEEKKNNIDRYSQFLENTGSYTFGAFLKTSLIGMITLRRESLIKLHHRAIIVAFYVKPGHQRKGIGKALLTKTLQHARQLEGLEQVYLSVVATNERAKNLYSTKGFQVISFEKNAMKFEDTYYDEEQMVLFLNE
ncbi:Ribosomal protein S18 acetylase RimI [Gracilibacillus ureilyticus]|uniref:Ribosomal protein S18 acetylase RimI n=1 Tax=Gracilibacillus ureilyticus TaxID=531814 RepID=A0A1H9V7Y3_9BACI|nr:GNAT family N-acetyltransferase [Gracilibacillus ureilyticus]SES17815.1 Ribosomal protein S18 acetylase RimI [Gracilibacillus ureilyticus]